MEKLIAGIVVFAVVIMIMGVVGLVAAAVLSFILPMFGLVFPFWSLFWGAVGIGFVLRLLK